MVVVIEYRANKRYSWIGQSFNQGTPLTLNDTAYCPSFLTSFRELYSIFVASLIQRKDLVGQNNSEAWFRRPIRYQRPGKEMTNAARRPSAAGYQPMSNHLQ